MSRHVMAAPAWLHGRSGHGVAAQGLLSLALGLLSLALGLLSLALGLLLLALGQDSEGLAKATPFIRNRIKESLALVGRFEANPIALPE
jgi:hypothetical protein